MRRYTIKDPAYRREIYLIVGEPEEFLAWVQKRWKVNIGPSKEYVSGSYRAIKSDKGYEVHFIWFRKFEWYTQFMGLLAHEVFHFVVGALGEVHIPLNAETEEAWAYYLDSIYRQCAAALCPKGTPKAKAKGKTKR